MHLARWRRCLNYAATLRRCRRESEPASLHPLGRELKKAGLELEMSGGLFVDDEMRDVALRCKDDSGFIRLIRSGNQDHCLSRIAGHTLENFQARRGIKDDWFLN